MSWIGAWFLATLVLFFAQGFLLQVSVALTGEPAPKFGHALKTTFLAGLLSTIATTAWGFTVGLIVGRPLSAIVSSMLLLGIMTLVYRRQLGSSVVQSFVVAVIHTLLGSLLSFATWGVVDWLV